MSIDNPGKRKEKQIKDGISDSCDIFFKVKLMDGLLGEVNIHEQNKC